MVKTRARLVAAEKRAKSMPLLRQSKGEQVAQSSKSKHSVADLGKDENLCLGQGTASAVCSKASAPRTLPREIIKNIVCFALTSNSGKFNFPSNTNAVFKPGVNLSCLLIDRDLYHTARQALFANNIFIFSAYGSDIQLIPNCVGLYSCRAHNCLQGSLAVLSTAVLEIGDSFNSERSGYFIMALHNVLKGLRRPLQVEHLTIQLKNYAWRVNSQLTAFCASVSHIKVLKKLTIKGIDVHLELALRQLPKAFGFDVTPSRAEVTFREASWQKLGYFVMDYTNMAVEEEADGEQVDLADPQAVDDCKRTYNEWLKTTDKACINNGLDYINVFGYSRTR